MNILIIGGGGREHALVWKLKQSSIIKEIYCVPGNAGICSLAKCVEREADDFAWLSKYAINNNISLTIVGPEAPLIKGIVDYFEQRNLKIFGPTKAAAQLEGSKVFAKNFMKKYSIPTARFVIFNIPKEAIEFVRAPKFSDGGEVSGYPLVIKADGPAAGKGVIICHDELEAEKAIDVLMLKKAFGEAGNKVVIEECLQGEETSIISFTDGEAIIPMVSVQDHKRVYDDDKGPNTGGMGCYAPVPFVDEILQKKIYEKILLPTIQGLKKEQIKYQGIIYAGLMIVKGEPFMLEYNVRFGDPETQVIMPLLKTDLIKIIQSIVVGKLSEIKLEWEKKSCVCVVLASGGYPGGFAKGKQITGLEETTKLPDTTIFHAGTSYPVHETEQGLPIYNHTQIITSGGRVLGVTSIGDDLKQAREKAYAAIEKIKFEGMHYRKDIGEKGLKYSL